VKKSDLRKIIREEIKHLREGGESAGNMELVNISLDGAKKHLKKLGLEIDNFDQNFLFAQKLAGLGRTKRKDMPVIDDDDVRQFQTRLKKGYIDINEPFSPTYDKKNPYPTGLSGFNADDFVTRGLKDKSKTDDQVEVTIKQTAVGKLKPIQKQIYFDKSIGITGKIGIEKSTKFLTSKTFFITSDDNYIIDGHHR